MERLFFLCKLDIIRPGTDYELSQQVLRSMVNLFTPKMGSSFFSIGGAKDDYIYMKNLFPKHVVCGFSEGKFIIEPFKDLEVYFNDEKQNVTLGESLTLALDFSNAFSFKWKIVFNEDCLVMGKIMQQDEKLPEAAKNYLESNYGTIKKIYEGNSSLIFKTKDARVLKILRPSWISRNPSIQRRFINAARKFAKLPGNLFFKILEIGFQREHGLCYVVTEKFQGESLSSYLAGKGILPLQKAQKIVSVIAAKLKILEEYGYCCRSLDPAKILISEDGEVRLTGFLMLKSDVALTSRRTKMVTANYSSPEQLQDPSSVAIDSDIFSLGAIFYHMVIGEPPFSAKTGVQYMQTLLFSEPLTPEEIKAIAPYLPQETCNLIASLIDFRRDKRPSPQELISILPPIEQTPPVKKVVQKHIAEESAVDEGFTPSFKMLLGKVERTSLTGSKDFECCIDVIEGPGQIVGHSKFSGDFSITLGRDGDIRIARDGRMSRHHARIESQNGIFTLIDLGSRNGVYIDGEKITSQEIFNGEEFVIGDTVLCFSIVNSRVKDLFENDDEELKEEDIEELTELRLSPTSEEEIEETEEQEDEKQEDDLDIAAATMLTGIKLDLKKKKPYYATSPEVREESKLFINVLQVTLQEPELVLSVKEPSSDTEYFRHSDPLIPSKTIYNKAVEYGLRFAENLLEVFPGLQNHTGKSFKISVHLKGKNRSTELEEFFLGENSFNVPKVRKMARLKRWFKDVV